MSNDIWIPLWVALIAILPSLITSITAAINSFHLTRMKELMVTTQGQIKQLETNTNHKMDLLLDAKDALRESTNAASRAEGVITGKAEANKEQESK